MEAVTREAFEAAIRLLQTEQARAVKRQFYVELGATVVAALGFLVLVVQSWQTQTQVRQQREEINEQKPDTLIVRRAQLIAIIYGEICDASSSPAGALAVGEAERTECRPKATVRARQEAVLAFVEIEQGRGVRPNLMAADLSEADLGEATLVGAALSGATLIGTDLSQADLDGAYLIGTDLRGADLGGVTLNGADLIGADLREANLLGADLVLADLGEVTLNGADLVLADLGGANLSGADLGEANLRSADLRGAYDLTQVQLDSACGDEETKLPEGLPRPDHWPCEPSE